MSRIGGFLSFSIDGTTYTTEGSVTLEPSSTENEARVGHDGTVNHSETRVAPRFDSTVQWTPEVRILALGRLNGSTVTWQLANGVKLDFIGAVTEGRPSADGVEGTISLPMFASKVVERT